jgi:hypothetical protein
MRSVRIVDDPARGGTTKGASPCAAEEVMVLSSRLFVHYGRLHAFEGEDRLARLEGALQARSSQ